MSHLVRVTYTLRGVEYSRIDTSPVARAFVAWLGQRYPAVTYTWERVA